MAPRSCASQTASRLTQAAAADVDQVLGEQVVAQRHRPAAEAEEREVGGLAGPLAEGGVEAADLLGGVAAGGRQDADPRPPAGRARSASRSISSQTARSGGREVKSWPPRARMRRTGEARHPRAARRCSSDRHQAATAVESASGSGGDATPRIAEEGGGDPHLDHPLAGDVEPVAARLAAARRRPGSARRRRSAGRRRPRPRSRRASPRAGSRGRRGGGSELRLVVDAVAERQQAQALDPPRRAVEAGHRLGEPAERAGREAAEDDPRFPGLAQDLVDPVRPPDAEQADHAAAADVDQVLGEEVARAGPRGPARGGRGRCGWPRSDRRGRRGRSGRCSGRRRRWPRAGSRPAAAPPRQSPST